MAYARGMRPITPLPMNQADRVENVHRFDVAGQVVHVSTEMIRLYGEAIPVLLNQAMDIIDDLDIPDGVKVHLPAPEVNAYGVATFRAEWFPTEPPRSTDGEWTPASS